MEDQVVWPQLPHKAIEVTSCLIPLRAPQAGSKLPAWSAVLMLSLRNLDEDPSMIFVAPKHEQELKSEHFTL